MVGKTKASKGTTVAKTQTISGQPPSTLKTQWDSTIGSAETAARESGHDSAPEPVPPSENTSARGKKDPQKQAIGEQLSRQLRSVYNDVLAQPVPDRFLDLLQALEKDPK